jgi:hypothetical protein
VPASSSARIIRRGEKLTKPKPRSSSRVMTAATVNVRVPTFTVPPTRVFNASSKGGSSQTVPGGGIAAAGASAAPGAGAMRTAPRSGYPGDTPLIAASRDGGLPPADESAVAVALIMLGKMVVVAVASLSDAASCANAGSTG